ncbi:urease accessory protein UreD [Geminicoccus roseus]|uniref:urease accessory protein UreD n=1 Tax=Geminicoccus roseus TaxID=404900 RepID=UPI000423902C|nr:urease accessory protein UreD [Geminicoccus roseus]
MTPALDLSFRLGSDGRTVLAGRRVRHPFSVQAPLWDVRGRPACARVFIQSTSGGIFSGDRINQRVAALAGAELRVEMPAAMVVHAMRDGGSSSQRVELVAEAGSRLEFLPLPLILFPDSRLDQEVRVVADPEARLLVADGFMMHGPARSGGSFERFRGTLRLERPDGRLVMLDRMEALGQTVLDGLPGVTGAEQALGSLLLVGTIDAADARRRCREIQAVLDGQEVAGGATPLRQGSGLLVRMLARDGGALVQAQAALVPLLRGMLHG